MDGFAAIVPIRGLGATRENSAEGNFRRQNEKRPRSKEPEPSLNARMAADTICPGSLAFPYDISATRCLVTLKARWRIYPSRDTASRCPLLWQ